MSLRTDISNLKRIQRKLEEARHKAEEANRAKGPTFRVTCAPMVRRATPLMTRVGAQQVVVS